MALRHVSLDDKYDLSQSRVFVTGYQAIIRLCLMQKERDRRAGLNTAGYVSGYRGSPLGGLDQQFWRAKSFLERSDVVFQPGINEDLAATALWGTQQAVTDAWLAECNSPNTRLAYRCDVDMFGRWCVQRETMPLHVDTSTVLAFESARRAAGDSPATLRRRRDRKSVV